jgi:hypothetical protein
MASDRNMAYQIISTLLNVSSSTKSKTKRKRRLNHSIDVQDLRPYFKDISLEKQTVQKKHLVESFKKLQEKFHFLRVPNQKK